jgi:hypothetical protein
LTDGPDHLNGDADAIRFENLDTIVVYFPILTLMDGT